MQEAVITRETVKYLHSEVARLQQEVNRLRFRESALETQDSVKRLALHAQDKFSEERYRSYRLITLIAAICTASLLWNVILDTWKLHKDVCV